MISSRTGAFGSWLKRQQTGFEGNERGGLPFGFTALSKLFPALALVCTSVFAYGLCGPQIGWLSDDYGEAFGLFAPVPDWRAAFTIGGAGRWSPYRLLKYPIQGYLGLWLGPGTTHIVQFLGHVVCVLLFYALLKLVSWPTPASLAAAMIFSASPWLSEAVYWWPASSSIWATLLVLAAAHCLIRWGEDLDWRWSAAYVFLVLLSLVLYELWLGGFVFFAGLDWYFRRNGKTRPKLKAIERPRPILRRYAVIVLPFLIYLALYRLAPSADASGRVTLPFSRIPYSVALIHLRALQWPIDTQWRWTFTNASLAFHSAFGVFTFVLEVAALLLLVYRWMRKFRYGDHNERVPLWDALLLAWALFFGSRIVLILQGFISRYDTRENYGGSMGVAIAVVAIVSALLRSQPLGARLRSAAGAALLAAIFVLGWASAGIGVHYIETTRDEARTIDTLYRWMSAAPFPLRGKTIVVVAAKDSVPHGTIELSYFNEHDGTWLDYVIKHRCRGCTALVTDNLECVAKKRTTVLREPLSTTTDKSNTTLVLGEDAAVFRWTGSNLMSERTTCQ